MVRTRGIARQLGGDVHTIHGDVAAELRALRERTVGRAEELRAIELEGRDQMVAWLWPLIQSGSLPPLTAGVRVSERRARLLGLDEPTATKTELTGSYFSDLSDPQGRTDGLLLFLSFEGLRDLADKLFASAFALAQARRTPVLLSVAPSPAADADHVVTGESTEQSTAPTN